MKIKLKYLPFCIFIISSILYGSDDITVCLFWNRSIDSVFVAAMNSKVFLGDTQIFPGDTIVIHHNTPISARCSDFYAISDGRRWRMISNRCYGEVGKGIYLKIPVQRWVLLTLLGEFPGNYPVDALKAGAVVLRSFVLSGKHHDNCDVCDRTHCALLPRPQKIPRKYITATNETNGLVLTYNDEIIPATLTANCGGKTIPANILWGGSARWSSSITDTFCEPYKWQFPVLRSELLKIFKVPPEKWHIKYKKFGTISWVDIGERLSGFKFWTTLVDNFGWGTLCSPTFEMHCRNDSVYFDGIGFGHRVGLCQNGAKNSAKKGLSYEEILKYYFPKAEIKKIRSDK